MCRSQTLNTSPFVKREVQAKAVTHLLQYSKSFRKRVGERHWFELEHAAATAQTKTRDMHMHAAGKRERWK